MIRPARHRNRGLSLIELMIAILIGLILSLAVVQIYGAAREAYRLSEGMSRVQESGRYAIDSLQRDLRMAGHFGCASDQARHLVDGGLASHFASGSVLDFGVSIRGYDGAPAGLTLSPAALAGNDSVVLRFLAPVGAPVLATHLAQREIEVDSARWPALTGTPPGTPQLFGIADCAFADVFAAASVSTGKVRAPAAVDLARYVLGTQGGPATLYRAEALVYYVGTGASGRPSLFRARIGSTGTASSEELVDGVENLQLRYGLDQSADPDNPSGFIAVQADATDVGGTADAWRRVGQVQAALLIASPDMASSLQRTQALRMLGVATTVPDDRRFRAVYETSISLRNRMWGR